MSAWSRSTRAWSRRVSEICSNAVTVCSSDPSKKVVQAVVLCSGALYIGLNLLADLAQRLLDPRVRKEGQA